MCIIILGLFALASYFNRLQLNMEEIWLVNDAVMSMFVMFKFSKIEKNLPVFFPSLCY